MKIWYVHPYAGGPGVGRYWRPYSLASEWQRCGVANVVFCASYHHLLEPDKPRHGRENYGGVQYRFVRVPRYVGNGIGRIVSMLAFTFMLPWFGWRERAGYGSPDLIIYSSPHPFGFFSIWLVAKLMRVPLFFEVRDIWPLSLVEIAGVSASHPITRLTALIERFAYRHADRVVCLLPMAQAHMRARGLAPRKFVWISNGIGREELDASARRDPSVDSAAIHQIVALKSSGRTVFVYAGAHGEPNALHRFLDAAQCLKKEGFRQAAFVLIGKGEQRGSLIGRAQKEGLDFVHFYEQQPKETVLAAIQLADVGFFVMHPLPIYSLGISLNKLFDYMSCAIPIVAAYTAGNDPVTAAGCGLTVPAGDPVAFAEAVRRMCAMSPRERIELGRRGRVAVEEQYSYGALALRYLEVYRSVRLEN